jgi:hypothetical protein
MIQPRVLSSRQRTAMTLPRDVSVLSSSVGLARPCQECGSELVK